jgi:hypothetical protein
MKRTGIEILQSGVKINWDSHHTALNPSAKNNYQRRIEVSCISCDKWRSVNSCAISTFRKGHKGLCWKCHKEKLGKRNSTGSIGRSKTSGGYIIRRLSSFTKDELQTIKPMMRSPSKSKRENLTEVLEHRAIIALYLKRPLTSQEIVHHINGIKDDNRIVNLEIVTSEDHSRKHTQLLQDNKKLIKRIQELELELEKDE